MMQSKPILKVIKGQDIHGQAVKLEQTQPVQLNFFQSFLDNRPFSNTIDLYDALPKYYSSHQRMAANRSADGTLKSEVREFSYRSPGTDIELKYSLHMTPARLRKDSGLELEYFPSEAEEYIEAALRKLAAQPQNGVFLNDQAGVVFTQRELHRELENCNHGLTPPALRDALKICNKTNLELTVLGTKKPQMLAPIFPFLMLCSREEWESNADTKCYAQFNPLVTNSIEALTYRQFDYETYMKLKLQLSRWLFTRMSHNFTQASIHTCYRISAQRIISDSHLINYERLRDGINKSINKALEELQDNNILRKYTPSVLREGRKIFDVMYELHPTPYFSDEVKYANYRRKEQLKLIK